LVSLIGRVLVPCWRLLRQLKWLALALVGLALWLGLAYLNTLPEHSRSVRRDLLVTRLQNLQRLEVLQVHLLAHQQVRDSRLFNTNELLVVARGRAIYGVDLSQARLQKTGNQIHLQLPQVQVLELVIDPADVTYLGLKKGLLTQQQAFEDFKRQALLELKAELDQQARQAELYAEAEKNLRAYLGSLLESLGDDELELVFVPGLP
jgi:hypothetical protein